VDRAREYPAQSRSIEAPGAVEQAMRRFVCLLLLLTVAALGAAGQGPVVCIDPGHPSEVGPGTKGRTITEMRAAWLVALRMKELLEREGVRVVLTKSREDEMVRNRQRAEIANRAKADLMVRLHADAATGSGFAVYYPARTGTAQGRTGPSRSVLDRTAPMARRFHATLGQELKGHLRDNGLKTDRQTLIGGRQGALTGSIFSEVPVLLVEMCVLTNPKDDAFMASQAGQEVMARALTRATLQALARKR
jgi:N-acetylmuramoyl-L-alanine amidase